jgi:pyrroline-5-carboxylate reductase
MSVEALIRFYVGQGLREELSRLFYDRVLTNAAEVLARHNHSPEEIEAILSELRVAVPE